MVLGWERWLITVVFVATAAFSVYELLAARSLVARVNHLAHLAMSLAMVAMVWPWGMHLAVRPQEGIFAVAALWFGFWMIRGHRDEEDPHHSSRASLGFHAVMMATMVWMLVAMTRDMAAPSVPAATESMSGMPNMQGMQGMSGGGAAAASSVSLPAIVLGMMLVCAAIWHLATVFELAQEGSSRAATARSGFHTVMAAGMAVMLFTMS